MAGEPERAALMRRATADENLDRALHLWSSRPSSCTPAADEEALGRVLASLPK
jgi:hypothetical protein